MEGTYAETCYIDDKGDLLFTYGGDLTTTAKSQQFVDENNMPGIGRWLQENNIAKPTGVGIKSGYVTYQAYAFNVPKQSLTEVESRRRQLNTLPPRADDMRQAARPKIK